jgi:hypothetical protein
MEEVDKCKEAFEKLNLPTYTGATILSPESMIVQS